MWIFESHRGSTSGKHRTNIIYSCNFISLYCFLALKPIRTLLLGKSKRINGRVLIDNALLVVCFLIT